MNLIKAIYFWSIFWIWTILLVGYVYAVRLYYILTKKPRIDIFVHNMAILWGKSLIAIAPKWSVSVFGRENIPHSPNARFVIVANHESMTDIWALFFLNIQFRWLSKAEVFKIPVIGRPMKWAGYIPVKRGDKHSHTIALQRSAEWVKRGVPMLFFPEGTRSSTGELGDFKSGAFRLAEECDADILPITLKGTRAMMAKGSIMPQPSAVKLKILPLMRPQAGEATKDFAARVRAAIATAHLDL